MKLPKILEFFIAIPKTRSMIKIDYNHIKRLLNYFFTTRSSY